MRGMKLESWSGAMQRSRSSPEAQSIDSKDDKLAEAKANAGGVAGLLNGLGGLHQLLLVQLADLGLQGEGCNSADAGHCLCCCLVGLVKQLASLHEHVRHVQARTSWGHDSSRQGSAPKLLHGTYKHTELRAYPRQAGGLHASL